MISTIKIKVNAAHPNMPLHPFVAYKGSQSTVMIADVPKQIGKWKLNKVYVNAIYPDNSVNSTECVKSGEMFVGTVDGSTLVGKVTNGYTITASGMTETNEPITNVVLGKGDVIILSDQTTTEAGVNTHFLNLCETIPDNPKFADAYVHDNQISVYDGDKWNLLSSSFAYESTKAISATNALTSNWALTADQALTAGIALTAQTAYTSLTAETANEAQHSLTADYALTAENALTCDNASHATDADTAQYSEYANNLSEDGMLNSMCYNDTSELDQYAYDTSIIGRIMHLEKHADVRIFIYAYTPDYTFPEGQSLQIHAGDDATGPVLFEYDYTEDGIEVTLTRGMHYCITMSDQLEGYLAPKPYCSVAACEDYIEMYYRDHSDISELEEIQGALEYYGDVTSARNALVGKTIFDFYVDYDSEGEGDADDYSKSSSVDGHPQWFDPLIITDVQEVEDEEGQTHVGAILMRRYATVASVETNPHSREVATETTAQEGISYYGLTKGVTEVKKANLTLLTLSTGDQIPYSSYQTIYKSEIRDTSLMSIVYGYSDYMTSSVRQWLNSGAHAGAWWTKQYIGQCKPTTADAVSGYLRGCSDKLKSLIRKTKHLTKGNTITTDQSLCVSYDIIYLPSCGDYYSNTVENEGTIWYRYWQRLTGWTSPSANWGVINAQRKIKSVTDKYGTTFKYIRLRSAKYSGVTQTIGGSAAPYVGADTSQGAYALHPTTPTCVIY